MLISLALFPGPQSVKNNCLYQQTQSFTAAKNYCDTYQVRKSMVCIQNFERSSLLRQLLEGPSGPRYVSNLDFLSLK